VGLEKNNFTDFEIHKKLMKIVTTIIFSLKNEEIYISEKIEG